MKTFDDTWERLHKEMEWGKYPSEEVVRFIARNYYSKVRKNIRVLDFGCGAGAVSWYLAKEGFDTYGFDGSETAVNKAKARMKQENVCANLIKADAGNLLYNENFFDSVIDSAVICANTVENILHILKEINRVLKIGGKIFSTGLFNDDTTGIGTGEKIGNNTYRHLTKGVLADRGTVHFFSLEEIKMMWTEAGFKNIKIDKFTRTDHGGELVIGFYIVEAEK